MTLRMAKVRDVDSEVELESSMNIVAWGMAAWVGREEDILWWERR